MNMRKSKVLRKIRKGETAFCTKLNLCDPRVAELAAMSGIDCLWIDMEHVPSDYAEIENIIRAAKITRLCFKTAVNSRKYPLFRMPL